MNNIQSYIIFLLLIFHFALNAQNTSLSRMELFLFEDKTGSYDIQKILSPDVLKKFKVSETEIPSFAFTKSVIWCKLKVRNKNDEGLYLDVRPRILNTVVLYTVYNDGRIDSVLRGTLHHVPEGELRGKFLFYLSPDATGYYLKVKTNTRLFINLRILTKNELIPNRRNFTINSIYAGIVLMIFLYNLFLWLSSSDKIYFYYLLHLLANFVNFLYLSGFGNKFIWTNQLWVNRYFISIMNFGFMFSILFIIKFLNTKNRSKILHNGMLGAIGLLLTIVLIDVFGYHLVSVQLLNILGFSIILFTIFVSIKILKSGYKPAGIFLSAWMLYFIGISIQVLQGLNVIPTTLLSSNGMLIGSTFEIILLSLSIGYKINFLKDQMHVAAINEQKALSEKEKLMKEKNKRLELLAAEQSKQILEKNKHLKIQLTDIQEKNKKIRVQNEILQKAQHQLELQNEIIEKQYKKLVYHKNNLEDIISSRTIELQKAVAAAKESDEIKTEFLRNISHEVRTPMNAIAGFAGLLLNIDHNDHRNAYYKNIIFKSAENLLNLIENIIELSKIQNNELKLKKVTFNLRKMFSALYDVFHEKIKEQNKHFVSLYISVPENDNLMVFTDYNRLWQIMYQLLDNAVKYTDTGFVDFGYTVNKSAQLEISVKDSGKGISSENIEFIFEQFRKVNKDINKLYSGTGLGLSLVRGLVAIMGGSISVKSLTIEDAKEQNHGTRFIILFDSIIVK